MICTITNTRDTGTIEVIKNLSPTTRPGQVQPPGRRHDQEDRRRQRRHHRAGDGQHGHEPLGRRDRRHRHRALDDYTSSIACTRNGEPGRVRHRHRRCRGITVAKDDVVLCTITNTRNTGTIEVIKSLEPDHRPGQVQPPGRRHHQEDRRRQRRHDRRGDGQHGPTTRSARPRAPARASRTTRPSIACTRNGSPANSGSGTLAVRHHGRQPDDRVVCTITNTRKHRHDRGDQEPRARPPTRASSTSRSTARPRRPTPATAARPAR